MSNADKAKILIVDDEPPTCLLLREYFENRYQVEVAFDGVEALRKIREFQPECVVLDIRMPDMDGREVLRRTATLYTNMKIIMVTAIGDLEISKECLRLGAFVYVMKPLDLDTLEKHIQSALAGKRG